MRRLLAFAAMLAPLGLTGCVVVEHERPARPPVVIEQAVPPPPVGYRRAY